jgi:DNA-binding transcriptional LysR family regulator
MDLDLIRTFLAVYETGNFNRAAGQLHVTQSTVSSRIQSLEAEIGQVLFRRSRAGTEVTTAGRRFYRHATTLMRVWLHTRQEMVLPEVLEQILTVGGQFTLWDELLVGWLPWMRRNLPEVAIRAEIGVPEFLMQRLVDGTLDIGVMYSPQNRAGFSVDKLLDDRLVAVATDPDSPGPGDDGYIFVDWGPEFLAEHAQAFPDTPLPAVSVSHGMLALAHMLNCGGSAYLPLRTVLGHLNAGRLHRAREAPAFRRPAYVVYPTDSASDPRLSKALDGMQRVARQRTRASR